MRKANLQQMIILRGNYGIEKKKRWWQPQGNFKKGIFLICKLLA